MGLMFSDIKVLWQAKQHGAAFDSVLTIGRQSLFLHPSDIKSIERLAPGSLKGYYYGAYADDFLQTLLGISSLTTLDASPYEGAKVVHDLNKPVLEDLWNKFDAVIDGGSLEHIFNFPVAVNSLMRMVKVGGKVFITTPANNLCGHGFYQFSPELMFRVFSEDNGFNLQRVLLIPSRYPSVELAQRRVGYKVADPAAVGDRVGIVSKEPVMMTVEATKVRDVPLGTPQQSDYVTRWSHQERLSSPSTLKKVYRRLPAFVQTRIQGRYERLRYSFRNSTFYHRRRI